MPERVGATPVVVAVVDSGWDRRRVDQRVRPSLAVRRPAGGRPRLASTGMDDLIGHGTACARTILSQATGAIVQPVRIFDRVLDAGPATLVDALEALLELRPAVVNLSLCTHVIAARPALYVRCEALRDAGCVIVAAEQNGGRGGMPAVFDNAVGVGIGNAGQSSPIDFPSVRVLDVTVAPGTLLQLEGGEWQRVTSSSAATALVSGRIAAWLADRDGPADLDAVRRSFQEEPEWWRMAVGRCEV